MPHPDDVLSIVEVADATLAYDRRTKSPLYAKAGISEVWIVDVNAETIGALRLPGEAGYAESRLYRREDTIGPVRSPPAAIRIDDIFTP